MYIYKDKKTPGR